MPLASGPRVITGAPLNLPLKVADGEAADVWYSERSTVLSPNERTTEQRDLEQEAAAAAVLETIIRQLAVAVKKKKPLTAGRSGVPARRASYVGASPLTVPGPASAAAPATAPASGSSFRDKLRRSVRARQQKPEITKEEWDEAISQALY